MFGRNKDNEEKKVDAVRPPNGIGVVPVKGVSPVWLTLTVNIGRVANVVAVSSDLFREPVVFVKVVKDRMQVKVDVSNLSEDQIAALKLYDEA